MVINRFLKRNYLQFFLFLRVKRKLSKAFIYNSFIYIFESYFLLIFFVFFFEFFNFYKNVIYYFKFFFANIIFFFVYLFKKFYVLLLPSFGEVDQRFKSIFNFFNFKFGEY